MFVALFVRYIEQSHALNSVIMNVHVAKDDEGHLAPTTPLVMDW